MTAVPGIAPLLPGIAPSAAPTATVPALEKTATRTGAGRRGREWTLVALDVGGRRRRPGAGSRRFRFLAATPRASRVKAKLIRA